MSKSGFKKALAANKEVAQTNHDISINNSRIKIVDALAENYSRKGQPKMADELMQQRLRDMDSKHAESCVEVSVLYNLALAKEKEGDLKGAGRFYQLAVKQCEADDKGAGVVPESISDRIALWPGCLWPIRTSSGWFTVTMKLFLPCGAP